MAFPKDRIAIKILVYGLFVIETLQTALIVIDGFDVFATQKGDVLSLDAIRLYWLSAPVIGGLGMLKPMHSTMSLTRIFQWRPLANYSLRTA